MRALIDNSGWLCIALAAAAAIVGIILRRLRSAPPIVIRMRPHFVLGIASLIVAAIHMYATFPIMGMIRGRDYANGLDAATIALGLLIAQAIVGWRLQKPGKTWRTLRLLHLGIVAALLVTIAMHVILNNGWQTSAMSPSSM